MLETAPSQPAPHSLTALAEEAARTPLIAGGDSSEQENQPPLYAARRKVYPQHVSGTYRRVKWIVLCVTLGVYYLLPFVRWDRGPNAPGQAVLIDFPSRRFYFFFIEIWPQEFYYLTGLLILAAMALFLMNAIAGRLWCGYLCPQTVWTDLFQAIERWAEGDRREHLQRDRQRWTIERIARAGAKHFLWLMIAWWTGGAWVLYFADAPTLVKDLATFQAPLVAYVFIGLLTFTTYALAGWMREQVCVYMCPWPRIQAALTDEYALNVTYRYDRGEPRASVKKAATLHEQGLPAGDCIELSAMRACLPDRRRHPRRIQCRLHSMRPVHRCLRCRDAENRAACAADRLRHGYECQAPSAGRTADLSHRACPHGAVCGDHYGGRRADGLHVGDSSQRRDQRAARPQSDLCAPVRRLAAQRLYAADSQQEPRTEDLCVVDDRLAGRRHRRHRKLELCRT
jgi:polyferredoxin